MSDDDPIAAGLAAVRARIADAERAAGRSPGEVRLLLATKTLPSGLVRRALALDAAAVRATGARPVLIGENRVQEAVARAGDLADLAPPIHFIGPLQSNKVNLALSAVHCVQTVAAIDLGRRLATRCVAAGRVLEVMVQVNVSREPTKSGVHPDLAVALSLEVATLPGLSLVGLMTVGANSTDQGLVAAGYARLRALREEVLGSGAPGTGAARELSMGMSGDLEPAVAQGATIVRVGSAVFGSRPLP